MKDPWIVDAHGDGGPGEPAEPGPTRVLIVDDDAGVLAALTRLLRTSQIAVLTAGGGERALAVLEAEAPAISVIISDYDMPGMNGVELLRAVRLRWPAVVRVLLTGRADLPTAARAVNEGQVARLFVKPWDPVELQGQIAELVAQCGIDREQRHLSARDELSSEQLSLSEELRTGIGANQLRLVYQPLVRVPGGEVVGVEALVRWAHPSRGILNPDQFIGLAEQTDLIRPLTDAVMRAALEQCRAWLDVGLELPVSVNLSMPTLLDADLPRTLVSLLRDTGVPPALLTIELTESLVMADPERTLEVLGWMRNLGLKIAMDDFGTGHSSLGRLKALPVDVVKLDKSFVSHLVTDPRDMAVARLSVALGHDLGLLVLAEGIEDRLTWDCVARLGCDLGQGYYLGCPAPAAEIARRMQTGLAQGWTIRS